MFVERTLKNGLKAFLEHLPGAEGICVGFRALTGAADDPPTRQGLAHLAEHMAYQGSAAKSMLQIRAALEDVGEEGNAGTGLDSTSYSLSVLPEDLEPACGILTEVLRPAYPVSELEFEREVVIEEIRRYNNEPLAVLDRLIRPAFFGDSPLAADILGTEESVLACTREDLLANFAANYCLGNTAVAVAGPLSPNEMLTVLDRTIGVLCFSDRTPQRRSSVFEPKIAPQEVPLRRFDGRHVGYIAALPHVPAEPPSYSDVLNFLNFVLEKRILWPLRDKGLVYDAGAGASRVLEHTILDIDAGTSEEKLPQLCNIIDDVLAKPLNVTADELRRAKTTVRRGMAFGGQHPMSSVKRALGAWEKKLPFRSLKDVLESAARITAEEVDEMFEKLRKAPRMQLILA